MTDSIVQPLIDLATDVIGDLGVPGVFILMLLESACVPVPSEAIMLFAGFSVSEGRLTLTEVVAAGVAGNVAGSWVAYGIGYFGRIELLERHGRIFHVSPAQLARVDRWFARYGGRTVFFSRMLPIVRTFISLPPGVAKMRFVKFTALTTAGVIPWVLLLAVIGQQVGEHWEDWSTSLHYLDYAVVAAIAAGAGYLLVRRRRARPRDTTGVAPDSTGQ